MNTHHSPKTEVTLKAGIGMNDIRGRMWISQVLSFLGLIMDTNWETFWLYLLLVDSWFHFWKQKPCPSCAPLMPSITQCGAWSWSHQLFGNEWRNDRSDNYSSLPRRREDTLRWQSTRNNFSNVREGKQRENAYLGVGWGDGSIVKTSVWIPTSL